MFSEPTSFCVKFTFYVFQYQCYSKFSFRPRCPPCNLPPVTVEAWNCGSANVADFYLAMVPTIPTIQTSLLTQQPTYCPHITVNHCQHNTPLTVHTSLSVIVNTTTISLFTLHCQSLSTQQPTHCPHVTVSHCQHNNPLTVHTSLSIIVNTTTHLLSKRHCQSLSTQPTHCPHVTVNHC